MLDRESTFAQPEIVQHLKANFIPVAIDQANQRRQKDREGEFYRKIAGQSPRNDFQQTTQGFYVADAAGNLLLYNNNRDPEKLLRLLRKSLDEFSSQNREQATEPMAAASRDERYQPLPPEGGLVVRVRAKVLDGYPATDNRWRKIFQNALSRDNLWISKPEHEQIVEGDIPESLITRIARFHLVDNTRGEPPMWRESEIRSASLDLQGDTLKGAVHLETDAGDRGYSAELLGKVTVEDKRVVQFEMVSLGQFWGEGRFTRGAPEGKFPLAISFTLADNSDIADGVTPQGARGWLDGYCPNCSD